jgi:membrane protease YdiL (CAAX protease family)
MRASLAQLAAAVLRQYPSGPAAPAGIASRVEPVVTLLGAVLLAFTLAAMPLVMRLFAWIAGIDSAGIDNATTGGASIGGAELGSADVASCDAASADAASAGVESAAMSSDARTQPPAWGFVQIAAVLAWIIFFSLAMHAVLPADGETALVGILVRSALLLGTSALIILLIAIVRDPRGLAALGLRGGRTLRSAIAAWFAYVANVPGLIGLALLSGWLLDRMGIDRGAQSVLVKFLELDAADVPLALVLGVAVMPFLEELAFRAFLQPVLVRRLGSKLGIVATSLVFGGLHGAGAFLPIFGLSVLLGVVMLRTERLVACWAVHALHNGVVFAVARAHPELFPHGAWLAIP